MFEPDEGEPSGTLLGGLRGRKPARLLHQIGRGPESEVLGSLGRTASHWMSNVHLVNVNWCETSEKSVVESRRRSLEYSSPRTPSGQ